MEVIPVQFDILQLWLLNEVIPDNQTHHLAEMASKGRGVMGSQGTVRGKKVIWTDRNEFYVLAGGPFELDPRPDVVARLKETGLAKLTAEEKKALGL